MDKIKVAILCHFSNPTVRNALTLYPSSSFYKYKDFANWITNIISSMTNREDIELHVISPHAGMKKRKQFFLIDGVRYHFFRKELPYPWSSIEKHIYPQNRHNYPRNRRYVKQIIADIKPDIVNLIGAENAYYASSVLDIEDIPIVLHCQTVYANPERKEKAGKIDMVRWNTELSIFHKVNYFACTGRIYYDLIKGYEPQAIVFPRKWPVLNYPKIPDVPKKYDFAYFARMLNKNKGFDNALEAIAIAVKNHPELKIMAVGSWDSDREFFEKRIEELGIKDNMEIHPSFPDYLDMLQYVKQARFALLPIKMDVMSGTILEALNMGMPVVTCRTSGTPSLNKKRETVLLSDIGDNESLAANMLKLCENPKLAEMLKGNGTLYINEWEEEHAHNIDIMVKQYQAIIAHYNSGTPIPGELLYNTEENIDYRNE